MTPTASRKSGDDMEEECEEDGEEEDSSEENSSESSDNCESFSELSSSRVASPKDS